MVVRHREGGNRECRSGVGPCEDKVELVLGSVGGVSG